MSTASRVPETFHLQGDDARETIRAVSVRALARDTVSRFRWADGFSHARATAFQVVLTLIPGVIVLVAVAARLRWDSLSSAIIRSIESLAPGPASEVFRDAFERGNRAGDTSDWTAIILGSIAMLISGATAFGQVERTANRIYGVESDRPSLQKYSHALVLMLSAGTMIGFYFAVAGLGSGWVASSSGASQWWWTVGRWLLGASFLTIAITVIFQSSPRRRQPDLSWLFTGTVIAIFGVVLNSVVLTGYLTASSSFGETYGPLAGFLGLLIWAYLSSIAVYLGLAFAAQLEAARAGLLETRSAEKIEAGEPDTALASHSVAVGSST